MKKYILLILFLLSSNIFAADCSAMVEAITDSYHSKHATYVQIGYPENLKDYAKTCEQAILAKDSSINIKMSEDDISSNVYYEIKTEPRHSWWEFWK